MASAFRIRAGGDLCKEVDLRQLGGEYLGSIFEGEA